MAEERKRGAMSKDPVDRMLMRNFGSPDGEEAHMQSLEPSSGFVHAVMERVQQETPRTPLSAPGPIAFPWRRAVPGIGMAILAVIVCVGLLVKAAAGLLDALGVASSRTLAIALPWLSTLTQTVARLQIGWVLVALVLALLPLVLTRQMAGRSPRM